MQTKQFNKGDIIIRQGDFGRTFFHIEKGSAEVIAEADGKETKLTEMGVGTYFGEMSVLEVYPRSATVKALEDGTEVTEIPGSEMEVYFREDPDIILEMVHYVISRLRALTADYEEALAVYEAMNKDEAEKKSPGLLERIKKILSNTRKVELVSAETEQMLKGIDFTSGYYSKEPVQYSKGKLIYLQGEPGRCIYAIHWGKVGIYSGYGTADEKLLNELFPGQFFGESSLILHADRTATAVALEDGTTLEPIFEEDLKDLFENNPGKLDMIIKSVVYRLRTLTNEYASLQVKIAEKSAS